MTYTKMRGSAIALVSLFLTALPLIVAAPTQAWTNATSTMHDVVERAPTPKLVFAHFMVGIVAAYVQSDWEADMRLAQATGIDAFALNIGTDSYTDTQLSYAYLAANRVGFKLFISFDMAASPGFASDWSNQIVPRLRSYAPNGANVQWGNGALVSTFSGDGFNWAGVRAAVSTPLEIIPNYQAANLNNVGIDGAFNWNAWPSANNQPLNSPMTTAGDVYYQQQLSGRPYMAPVSPWFFTHYGPNSYNKNWLFLSDTLLIDRWNQILQLKPALVELITWNDFGESHYIGPLHPNKPSVYPGDPVTGAIRWVSGMPHDGWRKIIKPYIAAYKAGGGLSISAAQEGIVYWYRPNPRDTSCSDSVGRPTGYSYPSDGVWAATILASPATFRMTSGSNTYTTTAPAGINYYSIGMANGNPTFSISRNGAQIAGGTGGLAITSSGCSVYNFNAYVGSFGGPSI